MIILGCFIIDIISLASWMGKKEAESFSQIKYSIDWERVTFW